MFVIETPFLQAIDFAIGIFDDITTFNFQDPSLSGVQTINFFAFVKVFTNVIWLSFFGALLAAIVVLTTYDVVLTQGVGKRGKNL